MNFLPRIEEIILLAIWKLESNAYGLALIKQVEKDTGTTLLTGSIYGALIRLKKNGYVSAKKMDHPIKHTGRPRIYYTLTPHGLQKLASIQKVNNSMWLGVPDLEGATKN
jgi:DNA-binding PadR family transcriptional regulator